MVRKREWRDRALRWEKLYYRRNLELIEARKEQARAAAVEYERRAGMNGVWFIERSRLEYEAEQALVERDLARDVAVRLEQENAALHTVIRLIRQPLTGAITVDELLEITDFDAAFDPHRLEGATP